MNARAHAGPAAAICAVCGRLINSYESRWYGPTGAVHCWRPDDSAIASPCRDKENALLYPNYYTDG